MVSRPYAKRPADTNYTVLASADGGGFSGLITVHVFIELEDAIKRHILHHNPELLPEDSSIATIDDFEISLADFIDCFAATSAGSWSALYLASKGGNGASASILNEKRFIEQYGSIAPGSARGLLIFFNEYANAIFPQDQLARPNFLNIDTADPAVPGLFTPVVERGGRRTVLRGWFGDTTLSQLSASCFITGFDLVRRSSVLFVNDDLVSPAHFGFTEVLRRNHPRRRGDPFMSDVRAHYELDFYIRDIARGSSSAIPLVPSEEVKSLNGAETLLTADGALFASNPDLPAITHIANSTGDSSFSNTAVLSIGTGTRLVNLTDNANGGAEQWDTTGERILIGFNNLPAILSTQIEFLFSANPAVKPGQYTRVDIYGPQGTDLFNALDGSFYSDFLPRFEAIGQQVVEIYEDSIRSFVENFIFA